MDSTTNPRCTFLLLLLGSTPAFHNSLNAGLLLAALCLQCLSPFWNSSLTLLIISCDILLWTLVVLYSRWHHRRPNLWWFFMLTSQSSYRATMLTPGRSELCLPHWWHFQEKPFLDLFCLRVPSISNIGLKSLQLSVSKMWFVNVLPLLSPSPGSTNSFRQLNGFLFVCCLFHAYFTCLFEITMLIWNSNTGSAFPVVPSAHARLLLPSKLSGTSTSLWAVQMLTY